MLRRRRRAGCSRAVPINRGILDLWPNVFKRIARWLSALKRLASAVRFRPWPPCFQHLTDLPNPGFIPLHSKTFGPLRLAFTGMRPVRSPFLGAGSPFRPALVISVQAWTARNHRHHRNHDHGGSPPVWPLKAHLSILSVKPAELAASRLRQPPTAPLHAFSTMPDPPRRRPHRRHVLIRGFQPITARQTRNRCGRFPRAGTSEKEPRPA
jgi:hypothetical protein